MLINLLVNLSQNMKKQGIIVAPEQLFLSIKYILKSDSVTPDSNLQTCLKPILVNSVEDEAGYYKAWKALIESESELDKVDLYNLVTGSGVNTKENEDNEKQYEKEKQGKQGKQGEGKKGQGTIF